MSLKVGELYATLSLDRSNFDREMQKSDQTFQQGMMKMGTQAVKTGGVLTGALTAPIMGVGVAALKTGADFQSQMNRVRALTGATGVDLSALENTAKELGRTTQFSASQAADAMGFLAMAGFDANEIVAVMPNTLQLAAAAQLDLGRAADITSNILTGYGLEVADLGMANDVLVKAMSSANVDLEMLGQSFKYVGPIARGAGVEFTDAAAAIALLGNAGIQGSMAGTSLRQIISQLINPTGETAKVMERLGLNVLDAAGNLVPMDEILRQLEDSGATTADIMTMFGQRGGPAMAALLSQGSEALVEMRDNLEDSGGMAEQIASVQMEGLNGAILRMKSAWEGLLIAIAEAGIMDMAAGFAEKLAGGLQRLAGWVENLDPKWQKFILALFAILAVAGPVTLAIGGIMIAIALVSAPVLAIVAAIALLVAGVAAIIIWRDEIVRALADVAKSLGLNRGHWDMLMKVIQPVLDFIRTHAKTILTILAVSLAALIAPIALVVASFIIFRDEIMSVMRAVSGFIQTHFDTILTVLKILFAPLLLLAKAFIEWHDDVINAVRAVVNFVPTAFNAIIDAAKSVANFMSTAWNGVKDAFTSTWNAIASFLSSVWNTIANTWDSIWNSKIGQELQATLSTWGGWIRSAWDGIASFLSDKWNDISRAASATWSGISSLISATWSTVQSVTSSVWGAITNYLTGRFNEIRNAATTAWNAISSVTSSVWNAIRSFLTPLWNGLSSLASSVWSQIRSMIESNWNAIKAVTETVWNAIKVVVETIWQGIRNYIENTANIIKGIVTTFLQALRGDFTSIFNTIGNIVSSAWGGIERAFDTGTRAAKRLWDDLRNHISSTWNMLQTNMMRPFEYVRDNIGSVVRTMGNNAVDQLQRMVNGFRDMANGLGSAVNWVAGKLGMGSLIDSWGGVTIPRLASGTDYFGGGMAIVGERGPELVNLPRGSGVMPNSQTEALLRAFKEGKAIGGPGFGWAKDLASSGLDALKGAGSAVLGPVFDFVKEWIAKGAAALLDAALSAVGFRMPDFGGVISTLASGAWNRIKAGAVDYVYGLLKGAEESLVGDIVGNILGGAYRVSQEFGRTSFSGAYASGSHSGIDLAAPLGTPVYAAGFGTVSQAGWSGGYGNLVTLIHNGLSTLYAHLNQIMVSVGSTVAQGQQIGTVGSTGFSTGPHLHFEVREHGVPVNPRNFVALAKGGITDRPTLAALSETGGAEAVIPLTSPRARQMLRGLQGDGGTEVNFNAPVTIEARDRQEAERSAANFAFGIQTSMRARGLR